MTRKVEIVPPPDGIVGGCYPVLHNDGYMSCSTCRRRLEPAGKKGLFTCGVVHFKMDGGDWAKDKYGNVIWVGRPIGNHEKE